MKIKLLCLIFASTLSMNAAALEIDKGYLVSHKEWSIGNISGKFFVRHLNLPALQPLKASAQSYTYAYTDTSIGIVNGKVGIPVTFSTRHQVTFYNTGNKYKITTYGYTVCFNSHDNCREYSNEVHLDPKGNFHEEYEFQHVLTFNNPGIYNIIAMTDIEGRDSSRGDDEFSAFSSSIGQMIISN